MLVVPTPWKLQGFLSVAMTGFNLFALMALLTILVRLEGKTNAMFGKTIRENLSTIVPAVISSLIFTGFMLYQSLFP